VTVRRDVDAYVAFSDALASSSTEADLRAVLDETSALEAQGRLTPRDTLSPRSDALDALEGFTAADPARAAAAIVSELLPLCLTDNADDTEAGTVAAYRYRERLIQWLSRFDGRSRTLVRDAVLDTLTPLLQSPAIVPAGWIIARIGFRGADVADVLWTAVSTNDDEAGDVALVAVVALGVPYYDRPHVLDELHRRASVRYNRPLIQAFRHLADPASLEVVLRHWLKPDESGSLPEQAPSSIRILTDIASEHADDTELQDRIWLSLEGLFERHPKTLDSAFYLGGDMISRCNSSRTIPYLLQRIGRDSGESDVDWNKRYLLLLRASECVRPRQLEGCHLAANAGATKQLHTDACVDTGNDSRFQTSEGVLKKAAWDALLRLGDPSIIIADAFEPCVVAETNPFIRQHVCDRLACFQMDPLSREALKWVREPYDEDPRQGPSELPTRLAAMAVVGSFPSRAAFDALLHFGFRYDGHVLRPSVDLLGEQAIALTRAAHDWPEQLLVDTALRGPEPWHRTAAIGALEILAANDLVSDRHTKELESLLGDPSLPDFDKGVAISTIGYAPALS